MTTPEYMTVDQAAEWLGIHRQTLHTYVRQGRLPAFKLGRLTRFKVQDLRALIDAPKPPHPMTLKVQRQIASVQAAQEAHEARMIRLRGNPLAIRG